MGVTGILLCGFLVAHLAGNLLLYVGADAYNDYAAALHKQEWLIKIAEAGLITLFGAHVYLAFTTTKMNRRARRVAYSMKETKRKIPAIPGGANSWMFATGAVVLGFVIWHLLDFTIEGRNLEYDGKTPFEKALMLLRNPVSAVIYVIGCVALGIHLSHGIQSAFQSLGLNHPRYTKLISLGGMVAAWVLAGGFLSFVLWGFLFSSS